MGLVIALAAVGLLWAGAFYCQFRGQREFKRGRS